jgi:hypothetical protein
MDPNDDPYDSAQRRFNRLSKRFDQVGRFLGYSLSLWAPDGKTWRTVYLDAEFRVHWSDGWEHIWHWKYRGIFRVMHHGPATYGACTFFLNF